MLGKFYRNMQVNIFANQINLNQTDIITGANLNFTARNGQVQIEDFFGSFNNNGGFKITGKVSENEFRSIFQGQIAINHPDLNNEMITVNLPHARQLFCFQIQLIFDLVF